MKRSGCVRGVVAACGALLLGSAAASAEFTKTFTIQEPFGLEWGPDRVTYPVEFPRGEVAPDGVRLVDAASNAVPCQLSDLTLASDGKTVQKASVSFMATLAPNHKGQWTLTAGRKKVRQPESDVSVKTRGGAVELGTSRTGLRVLGGEKAFKAPVVAKELPAPIQGVRLTDGRWIGRGWWDTGLGCTSYWSNVEAEGPVFARVRLHYAFDGGKVYEAGVELSAGQDMAVVTEQYNLSEGRRYPMTGVDGMKPDVQYAYVNPKFDSYDSAQMWEWWGQTHAKLPTPEAYCFSVYEGLQPDSADFEGRSSYGNLKEGDGGLAYDKDGRFAYINAYLQWGDEETLYLGLYNSKAPASQVAFAGLRPSQWLHPDVDPHPNITLKQYVQTTCLKFERRKSGDCFMVAPVCLGKRVFGIGSVERTKGRHVLPTRGGPVATTNDVWASPLSLRETRMGRLELDAVKDWALAYDEPSKYPRLYVTEGDRARFVARATRKPLEQVQQELAAQKEPAAQDRKAVTDALAQLGGMVRHFSQQDYGHMDYGINEGLLADVAERALASPACTAEEAREIRKYLAAIIYEVMNPDFVPPREAGFAWGSANMMDQVRCRGAVLACLLPNHPQGKAWREKFAYWCAIYAESQINDAGATLECPHYGTMAVVMPAMALAALANCGDVDLSRSEKRLRAAAHHRLATLLPYDLRGGFRPPPTHGDSYYEGELCFSALIGFFEKRDPELAKQLAWGMKESDNQLGGHSDPCYKLVDPGMPTVEPKLGTERFPGFGFVMRNGFPRHDEAFVEVSADGFSWGHGHNDRGAWIFYAKGVPLMIDFAGMYTPSLRELWLHAGGLTFNHDESIRKCPGRDQDGCWYKGAAWENHAVEPFTDVEPGQDPDAKTPAESFGEVKLFTPGARADYAAMSRPMRYLRKVGYLLPEPHGQLLTSDFIGREIYLKQPFVWTRQYAFVKDENPAGNNYLVVRDDLPGNSELDPYLNLWSLADALQVNGQTGVFTGQHGVDLHCYVAEPSAFKPGASHKVGHTGAFGFARHWNETFKKPFKEEMVQFQIPLAKRDGSYLVAMIPVKQGEAPPKMETVADGKAIRVTFADRTDTIALLRGEEEVTLEGKTLKGTALLVTTKGGQTVVTDLVTGRVR